VAVELSGFGGAGQDCRGGIAAGDDLRGFVEIADADKALVRDGAIAELLRGDDGLAASGLLSRSGRTALC